MVKVNTENILFICGGAFDGIEKIVARRVNRQVIGFKNDEINIIDRDNLLQYINHQDVKTFGLIPELVGRMPVLTYLEPLDVETLKRILMEPRNSLIKQYQKLFKLENIELVITEDAVDFIASKALEFNLGARGLRSICEIIMTDAMFELPSQSEIKTFTIDAAYAAEKINRSKLALLKAA
jgi:ATP-dependent Clp protease ATP-binding subunit ClpX